MLNKGTRSLLVAKCVTTIVVVAQPTSAARAKVQALKRNMATTMLANVEFELCNGGLAIQGKV